MRYILSKPDKTIRGVVNLPSSKSIANRALIMNALSYSPYEIQNLHNSDDTIVMQQVLNSNTNSFDIGHAGTAMRFLTAFLSQIVGEWTITGSERMKQRPIKLLVDALTELGAKIEYLGNEGYPPLRITGCRLKGKVLELDGSVSSQYISALLMIAPTIQGGLTLRLKNKITSRPYITLTLDLMKQFGIQSVWKGNEIRINEQTYRPIPFTVEADWTAASYWYQLLALADEGQVELRNLQLNSLQGDSSMSSWFEPFGVESQDTGAGVILKKTALIQPKHLGLNFSENPDVAQTMAVLCVLKQIPFHFTGLETLKIKETDRISALQNELARLGAEVKEPRHGELSWEGTFPFRKEETPLIFTYHDHRMALAFAPAAMFGKIEIDDPMVITKSYPTYYDDLKQVGFEISE
ncbi:3-phosphoshikimate 1-carboxyvinyltransferase [Gaoshiqia sp. Z1-71]|uniref:3-phosphoshikimate 1-carboxyvinyltransferase n=1 Tax=Gaoshiqia hydrogeniformans TaxID=3290090 RepID=UPI003BF7BF2F